jgi:hypothetical protein
VRALLRSGIGLETRTEQRLTASIAVIAAPATYCSEASSP